MVFADYLNSLYLYKVLAAKYHKCSVKKNPENEMRRVYYKTLHTYPNLSEPKNLIEKICVLYQMVWRCLIVIWQFMLLKFMQVLCRIFLK